MENNIEWRKEVVDKEGNERERVKETKKERLPFIRIIIVSF
jgi:hypothetical protein